MEPLSLSLCALCVKKENEQGFQFSVEGFQFMLDNTKQKIKDEEYNIHIGKYPHLYIRYRIYVAFWVFLENSNTTLGLGNKPSNLSDLLLTSFGHPFAHAGSYFIVLIH